MGSIKINYNTRSNVWGHLNLKTKLTKKKWKNTFLYSNLHKFAYKKKRKNKFKKHLPPLKYVYKNNLHEKLKLHCFE